MKNKTLLPLALSLFAGISHSAQAADPTSLDQPPTVGEAVIYPYIEGEFIWELQGDFTTDSDDPASELNDVFGYLELAASFFLNENIQLNFALLGEPVLDPGPGEDRFFEDHGLYLEVLNTQINFSDDTNLVAGKFGTGFGTAWDATPGIYGVDFAEDYQLSEFLGFGLNHTFNGENAGVVTLGASIFFADTTFLSDSLGTRRGRTDITSGGAGNTESLESFAVSLEGEELPGLPGFAWHLGYRHLAAGLGDVADEYGIVGGFIQEVEFSEQQSATFNFEFATFDNFGGGADDSTYFTAGLTLANGPWHADIAGTLRNMHVAAGPDVDDKLF